MENANIYKCHDVFMVRTPSLPINIYSELDSKYNENVEKLIQDYNLYDFFGDNLLISSKNLYDSFKKYTINKEEGKQKKIRKYNESLLKYLIRSSSRPTPFGGLSKVGLAKFTDETDKNKLISISKDLVVKKISVDNSWFHYIVNLFESDRDVLIQLDLKINPLCYKYGNRFKNPYCSNLGNENKINRNNIKYSNLVEQIKEELNSFKSFNELCSSILAMYEGIDESIVYDTIIKLIKSEFILTELRTDLLTSNPLKKLISKLELIELNEEKKIILSKLKELDYLIFLYNNCNLNNINSIFSIMESIHKVNSYLMLNTGIKFNNNSINLNIKKDLEEFVNIFKYLYVDKKYINENKHLEQEFQEKYGSNTEISFIEFIDSNGFNAISKFRYKNDYNNIMSEREEKINDLLDKKLSLYQLNHNDEIVIEENDIKDDIKSCIDLPISFDLNIFITQDKMNKYNYFLGPNSGSIEGGAMFQRFEEVLDEKLFEEHRNIYDEKNEIIDNDYILAEIKEINSYGRITNIFNKTRNYEHYINCGFPSKSIDSDINIADLSVGVDDNDLFYIKYKDNKKIKFVLDNMINPNLINDVAYILYRITSNYNNHFLSRIYMFKNINKFYIPRIKIGKVIVFPKTWILNSNDFSIENRYKFHSELKIYINKFSIDKFVYLKNDDNRLLINLEKDIYSEIVLSSLRKNKVIELSEVERNLIDGSIVTDENNNNYVSEFVFTFMVENYKKTKPIRQGKRIINNDRCFNLFSDGWIYFKLYGIGDRDLEILNSIVDDLIPNLDKHLFFFIRYSDTIGEHLRVRFKFENKESSLNNITIISNWIEQIQNNGMINKVIFDVYERETNRYGGFNLISKAEELFESDSKFVISLLNHFDTSNQEELDKIYLFGVISILKILTQNLEELYEMLRIFDDLEYRKNFHKYDFNYVSFVENIINEKFEGFIEEEQLLKEYLHRKNKLIQFKKLIYNEESIVNIDDLRDVFLSISHMFCNRLHGNRNYEKRILSLAFLSTNKIINQLKYKQ